MIDITQCSNELRSNELHQASSLLSALELTECPITVSLLKKEILGIF